jgi:hypothetical protein
MNKYTIYWLDGTTNVCAGPTFKDAFFGGNWATIAGYIGSDGSEWWPHPSHKPK